MPVFPIITSDLLLSSIPVPLKIYHCYTIKTTWHIFLSCIEKFTNRKKYYYGKYSYFVEKNLPIGKNAIMLHFLKQNTQLGTFSYWYIFLYTVMTFIVIFVFLSVVIFVVSFVVTPTIIPHQTLKQYKTRRGRPCW